MARRPMIPSHWLVVLSPGYAYEGNGDPLMAYSVPSEVEAAKLAEKLTKAGKRGLPPIIKQNAWGSATDIEWTVIPCYTTVPRIPAAKKRVAKKVAK